MTSVHSDRVHVFDAQRLHINRRARMPAVPRTPIVTGTEQNARPITRRMDGLATIADRGHTNNNISEVSCSARLV
jgi:hypothetical protein